jgi:hypothetical protein
MLEIYIFLAQNARDGRNHWVAGLQLPDTKAQFEYSQVIDGKADLILPYRGIQRHQVRCIATTTTTRRTIMIPEKNGISVTIDLCSK